VGGASHDVQVRWTQNGVGLEHWELEQQLPGAQVPASPPLATQQMSPALPRHAPASVLTLQAAAFVSQPPVCVLQT
jgi:hypothetical protein